MKTALFALPFVLVAAVACGCRTTQPDLKPPTVKEVLVTPPAESRFNSSVYPAAAFKDRTNKLHNKLSDEPANINMIGRRSPTGAMSPNPY